MAKYSIVYFKSFVKDYKKLNAKEQALVDEVITSLRKFSLASYNLYY